MTYLTFLDAVIERGLKAARADYAHRPDKLAGAVAGFEACRDLGPTDLRELLASARDATVSARRTHMDDYWRTCCFESEVEWVCNVISVYLQSSTTDVRATAIVPPTAHGFICAAQILGVTAPS
jgi:hypothetical protein